MNKGDELLGKLLKVKTPAVLEPDPGAPPDLPDEMDQMLKNHPGLTREEAEEMIKAYGF